MDKKEKRNVDLIISRSLQIGVLLSAAVMLAGLVLFLITGNSGYAGNHYPVNPIAVFQGVAGFKPYAIILTGLILLILTPVFRVGVSIFAFYKEKDYVFVKITSAVFIILIISFVLGKVE